ncbi:MAG: prolyl oligopeptidase family serine peptidase [Coriobacteriia bacterium]|nr:prolyl oligopeptidase family serine peptidase [Coriobacteriia bacterium]MBS5477670.1 prolyl oligopeptidase family serine peptidase [Coriobacteriia bacterium]
MTNWVIGHTDRFRCANSQRSIANYMTKCLDSDIGYWVNMPETTGWLPGADDVSADPDETSVLPIVGEEKVGSALAFEGDNPWRIWAQSPLAFAGNVHTPTLFLHSDEDYRCPLNEGMQMFTALQLRGVPSRLVIFKGECHGLCRSGKPQNRVRRLEEILSWYERWLGGEPAEEGTPAGAEA